MTIRRLARQAYTVACIATCVLPFDTMASPDPAVECIAAINPASPAGSKASEKIFIGGVLGMDQLVTPAQVAPLLASGQIGLYLHGAVPGKGLQAFTAGQRSLLLRTWKPAGLLPEGGGYAVGEVGCTSENQDAGDAEYRQTFGPAGRYPIEINMNCSADGSGSGSYTANRGDREPGHAYPGYVTAADLLLFQSAMRAARRHGAFNVAVFATPNNSARDLDDPFATTNYYENDRRLAVYGGGIALDTPADFFLHNPNPLYQTKIVEIIRWGNQQGLRVSLVVSPWTWTPDRAGHVAADGFDTAFVEHIRAMVTILRRADALPTQWIVENYSVNGQPNEPGIGPESLNAAALYLASHDVTTPPGRMAAQLSEVSEAQLQRVQPCVAANLSR